MNRYNRRGIERFKKGNVLISFLIGALGMALMLFGFIGLRINSMVQARCTDTASAVVRTITKESGSVDYIEAEFYADNVRYTAVARHHHPKNADTASLFNEGTQVTVFYSPFDPDVSYIDGANEEKGSKTLFIGMVIFLTGIILMGKAIQKNSMKEMR